MSQKSHRSLFILETSKKKHPGKELSAARRCFYYLLVFLILRRLFCQFYVYRNISFLIVFLDSICYGLP